MRKSKLWTLAMTLAAAMGGAGPYESNDRNGTSQEMSVSEFPNSVSTEIRTMGKNGEIDTEIIRQKE